MFEIDEMLRIPNAFKFYGRLITIHYSTQVASVPILLDAVVAMLLSIRSKYETKKLIAISSLMILLQQLIIFLGSFNYNRPCEIELPINSLPIESILIWPSIFLFR